MTKISLKSAPEVKRVVTVAFPEYKKHNAYLSVFPEAGMNINSYWDGGSKDEYAIVDLATMTQKPMPTTTHPYFDIMAKGIQGENAFLEVSQRGNVTLKVLPENFALVSAGTFCGKRATAHVYLPAQNMPKLLELRQ
mgnify:CR=1 FL=1